MPNVVFSTAYGLLELEYEIRGRLSETLLAKIKNQES